MTRKDFIGTFSILSAGACLTFSDASAFYFDDESDFAKVKVGQEMVIKIDIYGDKIFIAAPAALHSFCFSSLNAGLLLE